MIKSYVRVAIRNMLRHKGHAFINVFGLAVGMTACLLIMLWVQNELSFNRFHKNIDTLYRVEQDQRTGDQWYHVNVSKAPMAKALNDELPEIGEVSRLLRAGQQILLRSGDTALYEDNVRLVDPGFLSMFTFPVIAGDATGALKEPNSIVLTSSLADRLFGHADPVGKVVNIDNRRDLTVTAVTEDPPQNSDIRFSALSPIEPVLRMRGNEGDWSTNFLMTFVQIHPEASVADLNEKITRLVYRHSSNGSGGLSGDSIPPKGQRTEYTLAPVRDVHLHTYDGYSTESSVPRRIWIMGSMAAFILLIACINFMNLATARSARRAKEIGLRKIMGGYGRQIAGQFYGEAVIYAVSGMACALLLVEALLPAFNSLTGSQLSLRVIGSGTVLIGLVVIALVSGLVAGSYPAMVLSRMQPVRVLGRGSSPRGSGVLFRRVLVVIQFTLSILMIVMTLAVMRQIAYMKKANVGYNKEQVLSLSLPRSARDLYSTFKEQVRSNPNVLAVSGGDAPPSGIGSNSSGFNWDGNPSSGNLLISYSFVDPDYVETMGIELKEGRSFAGHWPADSGQGVLINEAMAKLMNSQSVVGARLLAGPYGTTVVGVMKDFHYQPLDQKIEPLVLMLSPTAISYALVRLKPGEIAGSVESVRRTWVGVFPEYPFQLHFLDEDFEQMYADEERLGSVLKYSSILAIIVACLGLYGLAAFMAEQKTKEVGVGKVLGASILSIVQLLSREFVGLVALAFVIATPVAWYAVMRWQEDFAYRADIDWFLYVAAGVLAALVASLTVGYHAVRAARGNPVESLKYE